MQFLIGRGATSVAKSKIESLATKGEQFFRAKRSDYRGTSWFPSAYETAPITQPLPSNFFGFCSIQYFDKYGRETRSFGTTIESVRRTGAPAPPKQLDGAVMEADARGDSAVVGNEAEDDEDQDQEEEEEQEQEPAEEEASDSGDDIEVEARAELSTDPVYQVNLQALRDSASESSAMGKALMESSIKRTALDSTEHERDVEMRYEKSRAAMILSHSYTKEVAENHQVSNLLRRDLVALAASLRQELQSRMADTERVSASVQHQIRQSAQLNIELGKMIRQQAAAAPVTPPPPLDVAGLGIALINAVGMIGSAWGPNRPQLPPAQTPHTPQTSQTPQSVPAPVGPIPSHQTTPPTDPVVPQSQALSTKESEEEKELQDAILVAEQHGGGDAASLIKLLNKLAAAAHRVAPRK